MRRLLALALLVVAVGAIAFVGTGAGGSSNNAKGDYVVRAEFRNAFSIISGEDVKIAGVKVGKIKSLGLTKNQTAAVVLDITEPGFGDWRKDATCTIRPQSLIGEKFVECVPTQPRAPGTQPPPLLPTQKFDGQKEAILPVSNTRRPVDLDLVNNILRLPYRERFTLLLNEFGAGLAGRGADVRDIIHNADPALKDTDEVLDILAKQNKTLRALAVDSDTTLAPLARDRAKIADFIDKANVVAGATADKRSALEQGIRRLPEALRQLRPTLNRLGGLSDQATPVLSDLDTIAPSLSRLVGQLGPFSNSATQSLVSLGDATVPGRKAVVAARPIVTDLKTFAGSSKGLALNLRQLTESLRDTGGIERIMDYLFFQVTAINGFDAYGHYLRAQLLVNLCSTYATTNDPACTANFVKGGAGTATSRSTESAQAALDAEKHGRSPELAREDAVLRGMSPAQALGKDPKRTTARATKVRSSTGTATTPSDAIRLPAQLLPAAADTKPADAAAVKAQTPNLTPAAPAGATGSNSAAASLLNYLLGSGT